MLSQYGRVACMFLMLGGSLLPAQTGVPLALHVRESGMQFPVEQHPGLEIPIVNSSTQTLTARARLQILDTEDAVLAATDAVVTIAPGSQTVHVPWSIQWDKEKYLSNSPSDLYWTRLRYTIAPMMEGSFAPVEGIVQMGRIIPTMFRLTTSGNHHPVPGYVYPLRIRIDDPETGKALRGIEVQAKLEFDKDSPHRAGDIQLQKTKTGPSGYAVFTFRMPENAGNSGVVVTARRGPLEETHDIDFDFVIDPRLTLTTDKPLYQPGQTAHLRALVLSPSSHAIAEGKVMIEVHDQQAGTVQFRREVTTSRFGVAHAEWQIPEKQQLGYYTVEVRLEEGQGYRSEAIAQNIHVSRYELPQFTVQPQTDKTYYLPGEQPRVDITAAYLFGKPVKRGSARIVREDNRRWNYRNNKWESDESDVRTGELDSSGRFSASLDVNRDFQQIQQYDYSRSVDLHFAAYVTDASTGRTEQRRFDVRLSKSSIHIYTIHPEFSDKEDLDFFIATAYPDGTPASVNVEVNAIKPGEDGESPPDPLPGDLLHLARVHTNRYGVAHVRIAPGLQPVVLARGSHSVQLLLEAADRHGKLGKQREDIWLRPQEHYLRIRPARRLHHPGDDIDADIEGNLPDQRIFVDVVNRKGLAASQQAEFRHGRAHVTFPFDPKFHGSLSLVAYSLDSMQEDYSVSSSVEVLFPESQSLDLGLRMQRTTYKPGEPATADLRVRSPLGKPVESALGVVVFDKAVAERVRTDEEFGRYGFWYSDYRWSPYEAVAGVSYYDLLDRPSSDPVSPDFELLAEAILATYDYSSAWQMFVKVAGEFHETPDSTFSVLIERRLGKFEEILKQRYSANLEYPKTTQQLREFLAQGGLNFDALRDPWDVGYYTRFSVSGTDDVMEIVSNGPDKLPGTSDDFNVLRLDWPYFRSTGYAMDIAAAEYVQRTGQYIRGYDTLKRELLAKGIDLDALRDPWGHPYSYNFRIVGPNYWIEVKSAGPDGIFSSKEKRSKDDVNEWTSRVHYFQRETASLDSALLENFKKTESFPQNEAELQPILQAAGLGADLLKDPWGHPYHFVFSETTRYSNHVSITSYSPYEGDPQRQTRLTPVTQKLAWLYVVSNGPEDRPDQQFPVAAFSRVVTEQSSKDLLPRKPVADQPPAYGSKGAIAGTVMDPQGAVISGATVKARHVFYGTIFATITDATGEFLLRNLPAGQYELEVISKGFMKAYITAVPVTSSNITRVVAQLKVGETSSTVEVTAEAPMVEATQTSLAQTRRTAEIAKVYAEHRAFTPRVRKYFPETLVWQPEVMTDSSGRAEIRFQTADNITTWKMSVLGSTADGEVGIAEKEFRTFQPFFIDHDPPKILTEGDRIQLPVVLRNYSAHSQAMQVEMESAPWFSLLSAPRQSVSVPANDDASARFMVRADHSIHEGRQKVTAANGETGDAVERVITVHPDGEEVTRTTAMVLAGSRTALEVEIPHNAIPGSTDAEVRIYPDLGAQVLGAVRGMIGRPAGCAEQTTSSAFANVLALQVLKKFGQDDPDKPGNPNAEMAALAHKYVREGHQRLRGFRRPDGGFAWWSEWRSDLAVTAHVLDFLEQSSEFVETDQEMVRGARDFLIAAQQPEGDWLFYTHEKKPKPYHSLTLTALIARVLAESLKTTDNRPRTEAALAKAMKYLEDRIAEWNGAYLVGEYALAAAASGRPTYIGKARSRLLELAHDEGPGTYWNLEVNVSPFFGWGYTGQLETTGLAVRALSVMARTPANADLLPLMNRGLVHLLSHKDRYGLWYSTYASVNVLKAIVSAMPQSEERPRAAGSAEVLVNGQPAATVRLPASGELSGPIVAELRDMLHAGVNKIEIVRAEDKSILQAQVISTHYIPWADSEATRDANFKTGDTRALRLGVGFDATTGKVGQTIRCSVEAERIGFYGYGMMLAEIGLPPGADVDRESLERARESSALSQYEVLPDRIVLYLWPQAGGTKLSFVFRPRLPMEATAAPSVLYDYYNPEAHATVAPARFSVH